MSPLVVISAEDLRQLVREEVRAAFEGKGPAGADDVLTYADAAADVKVDKSTIGRWVRDGLLPAHGKGLGRRVYRRDVRKALELSAGAGRNAAKSASDIATDILSGSKRKLKAVR